MQFAGVIPPDAPDPRREWIARAKAMPVPILGFVPQPHLEDWDAISVNSSTSGAHGVEELSAVITYTLWRNPDDRSDPANFAELDDEERAGLEVTPPWPRPKWILDMVDRMHYPVLWEAVRTTWVRARDEHTTVEQLLVHHVDHILRNRFRVELGLGDRPWEEHGRSLGVTEKNVQHGVPLEVSGRTVDGIRIDTDPFVYGIGADLGSSILTAVVPRDDLPYLRIAFAERSFE